MTNFEKYEKEILGYIKFHENTPARVGGAFMSCSGQLCKNCEYGGIEDCTVTFIKWLYEDSSGIDIDTTDCSSCKYTNKTIHESPCSGCRRSYPDKFELVPKKTRQSTLLEVFPNTPLDDDGVLTICPQDVGGRLGCSGVCSGACPKCRKEFWMKEVE